MNEMSSSSESEGAVRLCPLMGPLQMLVLESPTCCQVDCCGPDFFVIGPDNCVDWVRTFGLQDAEEAVMQLERYSPEMEVLERGGYCGKVTSESEEFNATWTPVEWRGSVGGEKRCLERSLW